MNHPLVRAKELSTALSRALEKSKWSRQELSNRSGADTGQICRILGGDFKRLSMRVLSLCEALDVKGEQFISKANTALPSLEIQVRQFIGNNSQRRRLLLATLRFFEANASTIRKNSQ